MNPVSAALSADEDHGRTSEEEEGQSEQSYDRQVTCASQTPNCNSSARAKDGAAMMLSLALDCVHLLWNKLSKNGIVACERQSLMKMTALMWKMKAMARIRILHCFGRALGLAGPETSS